MTLASVSLLAAYVALHVGWFFRFFDLGRYVFGLIVLILLSLALLP
jgi:hypothetical protein